MNQYDYIKIYNSILKNNMDGIILYFLLGGLFFGLILLLIYWITKILSKSKYKDYIPETAKSYKCLDGHITRSRGEMIIDNHLFRLNIKHEYEGIIKVNGSSIMYDWFLPDYNVYIEYWGYFGKEYYKRKEEKIKLYKKGKIKLISIEDIMLENIYKNLEKKLEKYISLDKIRERKIFCPKCGKKLDERFHY